MKEQRLEELFNQYINRSISEAGERELMLLLSEPELKEKKEALIESLYDRMPSTYMMTESQAEDVFANIFNQPQQNQRITLNKNGGSIWRRWAVAASIILITGIGTYFLFSIKTSGRHEIVKMTEAENDVKAPETNRAIVILANGQKILLDSAVSGQLATQGNVKLVKLANGQIAYETLAGEVLTEIKYNTLENPRGSKVIDMTLVDGSRVWLNAGSSVTYPVAFVGNERKVTITGEAYFEVAHDRSKPFLLSKGDLQIEVLGTHFNVNAYDDENDIKVTLLEGSVKIKKGNFAGLLKPGQQAMVSSGIKIGDDANVEEVMAWKNGKFDFGEAADISTIMKQISRWYDVEVEYKGIIKGHIGGTISRNINASQVFRMLEKTGLVTFQIDGKKVIVIPK